VLLLAACSTTKYIPEGQYLLDKVTLEMEDKGVDKVALLPYIQQNPNSSKWGLKIYNSVKNDSNFIRKFVRKMGEPPVIFNKHLVNLSVNELTMELRNRGYLNAQVAAQVDTTDKKAGVTYYVLNNEPYRIRNYTNEIPQRFFNQQNRVGRRDTLNSLFSRRIRSNQTVLRTVNRQPSLIKEGSIFDMNLLENERTRMSALLRNQGYYTSTVDNLHYWADTTLQSNQVDLTLALLDTSSIVPYTVQRVNVFSGYDPLFKEDYRVVDSVEYKGIHIYYDRLHFLRPSVIDEKTLIRPSSLFRERRSESMLSQFRSLTCISLANLQYVSGNYPDSTLLDCNIYLTPGDIHSLQAGLSGTNKAGDLGVALDVTYGHLNLFNGSELFNIHVRSAYEFVNGDEVGSEVNYNYYELGFTPSLTFPKLHLPYVNVYLKERFNPQTQYSLGYNIQRRQEYIRNFFNFNWKIRWTGQRQLITHTLSLLDINYVFMPWKSEQFQNYLNEHVNSLTKYSYENVFTAGIDYDLIYTNARIGRMRQHLYTVRFGVETSGNLLSALSRSTHAKQNDNGQYTLFGNSFAQYVKGDFDLAETFSLDSKNAVAFHVGLGVACPYGNSTILPFEKRYYAGGPNSVRGWNTRYLGPGSYNEGQANNIATHAGDISFILSAEYRFKFMSWLEPALFVDCGNIWTIKDYSNQPGGFFQWNKFYKELAVGAGLGLRFDLSFLILRLDAGTKVYNPARNENKSLVLFKENFWKNSAVYVAIGYPF
jgi:outer membrane protein assembly factor BamA